MTHATKQSVTEASERGSFPYEHFVDADLAAQYLMVKRRTILVWARTGAIPAHPFGGGKRVVWRFRLSELASGNRSPRGTMAVGSPEIARLEKQYG